MHVPKLVMYRTMTADAEAAAAKRKHAPAAAKPAPVAKSEARKPSRLPLRPQTELLVITTNPKIMSCIRIQPDLCADAVAPAAKRKRAPVAAKPAPVAKPEARKPSRLAPRPHLPSGSSDDNDAGTLARMVDVLQSGQPSHDADRCMAPYMHMTSADLLSGSSNDNDTGMLARMVDVLQAGQGSHNADGSLFQALSDCHANRWHGADKLCSIQLACQADIVAD